MALSEVRDIRGVLRGAAQLCHARDQFHGLFIGGPAGELLDSGGVDRERLAGMGPLGCSGKSLHRSASGAVLGHCHPGFVERFFMHQNLDEKVPRLIPTPVGPLSGT